MNSHLIAADATKNSFRIKFISFPYLGVVACFFFMTFIAGIIFIAAFEFYGNNIKRRVIVHTTGVAINWLAFYLYAAQKRF